MDPIRESWNLPVPCVVALELPWTPVYLPGIEPEPTDYVVISGLQAARPLPFVQIIRAKEGHTGMVGVLKPKQHEFGLDTGADSLLTLGLCFATEDLLRSAGISRVSQLAQMSPSDLKKIGGIGSTKVREIRRSLTDLAQLRLKYRETASALP